MKGMVVSAKDVYRCRRCSGKVKFQSKTIYAVENDAKEWKDDYARVSVTISMWCIPYIGITRGFKNPRGYG